METPGKSPITVKSVINAPVKLVWEKWTNPADIKNWCSASDDWHVPAAENDLRTGGKFMTRMEARDGSFGFDFGGVYDDVREPELISYSMDDGRNVKIVFDAAGDSTTITETFDPEDTNPVEMQQAGWQAILDNFKKYAEAV